MHLALDGIAGAAAASTEGTALDGGLDRDAAFVQDGRVGPDRDAGDPLDALLAGGPVLAGRRRRIHRLGRWGLPLSVPAAVAGGNGARGRSDRLEEELLVLRRPRPSHRRDGRSLARCHRRRRRCGTDPMRLDR